MVLQPPTHLHAGRNLAHSVAMKRAVFGLSPYNSSTTIDNINVLDATPCTPDTECPFSFALSAAFVNAWVDPGGGKPRAAGIRNFVGVDQTTPVAKARAIDVACDSVGVPTQRKLFVPCEVAA